jgi:NAD+ kinase
MTYGIIGNTRKDNLWQPAAAVVRWLHERGRPFCMTRAVAQGLIERGLVDEELCSQNAVDDLAATADLVLSFGGDGTLLNAAHEVGTRETPILGVNIGRLGFLAAVEVGQVTEAIQEIEAGHHRLEPRIVLDATIETEVEGAVPPGPHWALNDIVVAKSGSASMIEIGAYVDGRFLNDYWGDGLIVTTPTGSTAYSLAAGGPLIAPESGAICITPLAPHTLTARPIVLPQRVEIVLEVRAGKQPFAIACDGRTAVVEEGDARITIRRAQHDVRLVRLPGTDYFETIRQKLSWGRR